MPFSLLVQHPSFLDTVGVCWVAINSRYAIHKIGQGGPLYTFIEALIYWHRIPIFAVKGFHALIIGTLVILYGLRNT